MAWRVAGGASDRDYPHPGCGGRESRSPGCSHRHGKSPTGLRQPLRLLREPDSVAATEWPNPLQHNRHRQMCLSR